MSVLRDSPLKRRRRSQGELDTLDERLIGILEGIRPATVRQTYYQAVVHDLAEKDESGYNLIQRRLLRLRRQHRIPYNWITDNVRTIYGFDRHPGLESFAQDVASLYRRDYWANSDVRVEIWIEADSLASTITPVVFDWGLDLHVARGFSSETYLLTLRRPLGRPYLHRVDQPVIPTTTVRDVAVIHAKRSRLLK